MPHKNIAAHRQIINQLGQQTFLGRSIKVNDDIAAKNDVKEIPETKNLMYFKKNKVKSIKFVSE